MTCSPRSCMLCPPLASPRAACSTLRPPSCDTLACFAFTISRSASSATRAALLSWCHDLLLLLLLWLTLLLPFKPPLTLLTTMLPARHCCRAAGRAAVRLLTHLTRHRASSVTWLYGSCQVYGRFASRTGAVGSKPCLAGHLPSPPIPRPPCAALLTGACDPLCISQHHSLRRSVQ
ncbi:hypothetical protein ACK3TF_006107 [Chlorella vulgaris]